MDLMKLRKFETLGPFEIKDELIKLAKKTSRTTQSAFLNAGRGNPVRVAAASIEECRLRRARGLLGELDQLIFNLKRAQRLEFTELHEVHDFHLSENVTTEA